MITDFRHACVVVARLDRSLRFYRDMLGLKVVKMIDLAGEYPERVFNIKGIKLTYVKLRAPGKPQKSIPVFELHCWKKPRIKAAKGYNHISFSVRNLGYEYRRLCKAGVRFISAPVKAADGSSSICFAYDPDGNLIEFVEELKKVGFHR